MMNNQLKNENYINFDILQNIFKKKNIKNSK